MRIISAIAALTGMLAIVFGAFGAHSLKDYLAPELFQSFETGVRYMMYHALAILFIQNNTTLSTKVRMNISLLFLTGILFFSGSIFLITLGLFSAKSIWFVTPLGGLLFITGWGLMGISFLKQSKKEVTE